jgi:hypothetical protein
MSFRYCPFPEKDKNNAEIKNKTLNESFIEQRYLIVRNKGVAVMTKTTKRIKRT